ncbi:BZ3500_MvSof-1268-A1-R1_Chr1-1g01103 [Microbotryum saponariae]|uniref:BZ3500_MvSof-1268-A1-R1_Chr1-1g01103 protein n=1 Tax=Microbotryum saponariae TaxID=289078 RepID=A0A2X0KN68_9BASI|nr:BZ3500_MvSof-1268-A1-R1_Chr1-1g01103 [Microbotryum saponariae]SCZ93388.1 BZ3501_MvSof-1269-A2-R1_Chr1-1g00700 [Microbotryum saponariae]
MSNIHSTTESMSASVWAARLEAHGRWLLPVLGFYNGAVISWTINSWIHLDRFYSELERKKWLFSSERMVWEVVRKFRREELEQLAQLKDQQERMRQSNLGK